MESKILEINDLKISLNKEGKPIYAVDNISFSINEGEILGIAGESGSGKTLTALSIAGLLPQKAKILAGDIIYKNSSLISMIEKELINIRRNDISIIFQEYRQSLNPVIKVGRQIAETLDLTGGDKKTNKRRTVEMLFRLGFNEPKKIYNAFPHQLSGGMCQRIMAAIAAINCPKLLLADEPSSALDLESQNLILSLLMEMNRDFGTTNTIISHDLSIIKQFCHRYLVMYKKKIIEEGNAGEIFSPFHPYTQALIGATPSKEKRGKPLENIPGKVPVVDNNFTGCPFAPRCKKVKSVCTETFPPAIESPGGYVFCFFPDIGDIGDIVENSAGYIDG
jgi:peptide/nickel transport system ATP-binding protein